MFGIGALLVFLSAVSLLSESHAACGGSGLGETDCVLLLDYSDYQWATCLTDEYIRRVSNQNNTCIDRAAQECWYQCQLELNGLESGLVHDNCRCSLANTLPTPDDDTPTLEPYCFSPGGTDCSWYRECLEVRHPCEGTEGGYAIEYAERYCNLFIDHYATFTPSGRSWINGVRKCLQVVLVPALRPWIHKTCADIRSDAFESHPDCYLNPPDAPSICEIPPSDALRAFVVVNVIGDALTSAPIETGNQMLEVIKGCFGHFIGNAIRSVVVTMRGLRYENSSSLIVTKISHFIAGFLNLDDNEIGWFPYYNIEDKQRQRRNVKTSQALGLDDNDKFVLLLADLKLLNISSTPSGSHLTLDQLITAFSDAVSNKALSQIPVNLNGTDSEIMFGVSSLGLCGDTFCSSNTDVVELATAPPSGALKLGVSYMHTYVCIFVFMILYK